MRSRQTPQQRRKALDDAEVREFTPAPRVVETLPDLLDRGTLTRVGWEPPAKLSDAGWQRIGDAILAFERVAPWAWGDRWQVREGRTLPADWKGPDQRTLDNYAAVARAYPISRRRENVSFKQHAELTSLREPEQTALLDLCVTGGLSVTELRAERQRRAAKLPPPKPPPRIEPPKVVPPPAVLKFEPPESVSPPPRVEPPPADLTVPVYFPALLHAQWAEAAAGEDMSVADWIIEQIERARELRHGLH